VNEHRLKKPKRPKKIPPSPRVSRNPFEVWLMCSFVAWAGGIAFFGPPAAGVILSLPDWVRYGIATFIAVGAIISLVGAYFPDIILAAFFEFGGLTCITGPLSIYVTNIALNAEDPQAGLGAVALFFLLGCCAHRGWDVYRWLRYIYKPEGYEGSEIHSEPT